MVCWLIDFLTNWSQRVGVSKSLSSNRFSSTESPQGCVLSPLLFVLYTNDCQSDQASRLILKYADDSVIVSLLDGSEHNHGPVLDEFVNWCDQSFLQINVAKTKEMFIDFRRKPCPPAPCVIKGETVTVVQQYKYLGTVLDDRLKFDANTDALCKKVNQRLLFF